MKKIVRHVATMTLAFVIVLASLGFIERGFAQSSTVVRVVTSTSSPALGKSFTVAISVSNVQNLYGLEVILNWDPTILQATKAETRLGVESFSDGVLHESSNSPPIFIAENNITQALGEYTLDATSMAPAAAFSGSGNIVKITFNPISKGVSALNLQSQLLDYPPADRDPRVSLPIDHSTQGSSVTVTESNNNPSSAPSPTSSASESPLTPTPTGPSTSSTPSSTLEPQKVNIHPEFLLPAVVIVIVVVLIILVLLRKRKQQAA
jgi:hypothetical protein